MTKLTISSTNHNSIKTTEILRFHIDIQSLVAVFLFINVSEIYADLLPSVAGRLLFFTRYIEVKI